MKEDIAGSNERGTRRERGTRQGKINKRGGAGGRAGRLEPLRWHMPGDERGGCQGGGENTNERRYSRFK